MKLNTGDLRQRSLNYPLVFLMLLVLPALLFITACSSIDDSSAQHLNETQLTAENTGNFGPRPDLPTVDEIHRISPAQAKDFLEYMQNPANANTKPHYRLYNYLEDFSRRFEYEGVTYSATDTLTQGMGNCMSLAILTTALAHLSGLDIEYQLMDDVPVYEFNGKHVTKGVHIRSKIFDMDFIEKDGALLFMRPGISIDYFPTNRQRFIGNISNNKYLAMVYNNLAAEAFESGDESTAYWLSIEALQHDSGYSPAMNLLAVLNRRTGDLETAEFIYKYGIENAEDKLSILKNYHFLLQSAGRSEEAKLIQAQLDTIEDTNPFHWYQLGRFSFEQGEFREAIRYYNKALAIAPYLHEAYLGIALSRYELGQISATRNALKSAYEEAQKVSTRNLYESKLKALDLAAAN